MIKTNSSVMCRKCNMADHKVVDCPKNSNHINNQPEGKLPKAGGAA